MAIQHHGTTKNIQFTIIISLFLKRSSILNFFRLFSQTDIANCVNFVDYSDTNIVRFELTINNSQLTIMFLRFFPLLLAFTLLLLEDRVIAQGVYGNNLFFATNDETLPIGSGFAGYASVPEFGGSYQQDQYQGGRASEENYLSPKYSMFNQEGVQPEHFKIDDVYDISPKVRWSYQADSTTSEALGRTFQSEFSLYWSDVKNLYTWSNLGNVGVAIGMTGILANTSLDRQFIDWYQKDIRSSGSDHFAKGVKWLGEGTYMIPLWVGGSLLYGGLHQFYGIGEQSRCYTGDFFSRTARATVIGLPAVALGQVLLGAGRPSFDDDTSKWQPFRYANAVSGHAYIGAIPFLTIAQMTDNCWLKGTMYFGSTLVGWSRINDNAHYLSQVVLGWYFGYLATRAVSQTEGTSLPRGLTLFPIVTKDSTSLGFSWSY